MFYDEQTDESKIAYKRFLNAAAILGRYSKPKSKLPQIHPTTSEEIFCRAFKANNLARKDISIDAYKPYDGFGIKTFQGAAQQKIAEFNDSKKYSFPNDSFEIALAVSRFRNNRLTESIKDYSLKRTIYHYIYRTKDHKIQIFEQQMSLVNIDQISLKPWNKSVVKFSDGLNQYSFNKKKSTLYQNFNLLKPLDSFVFDPNKIKDLYYYIDNIVDQPQNKVSELSVVLPLFSERLKDVAPKSGLNQWNASGRPRDFNEVYIPIPKRIHRENPGFFPKKHITFRLQTDDNTIFLAKVCQAGRKALMSNPNKSLGEWILRKKLGLNFSEIATLDYLNKKRIDSVLIEKIDESNFKISVQNNFNI
jgi:hypothetical protein